MGVAGYGQDGAAPVHQIEGREHDHVDGVGAKEVRDRQVVGPDPESRQRHHQLRKGGRHPEDQGSYEALAEPRELHRSLGGDGEAGGRHGDQQRSAEEPEECAPQTPFRILLGALHRLGLGHHLSDRLGVTVEGAAPHQVGREEEERAGAQTQECRRDRQDDGGGGDAREDDRVARGEPLVQGRPPEQRGAGDEVQEREDGHVRHVAPEEVSRSQVDGAEPDGGPRSDQFGQRGGEGEKDQADPKPPQTGTSRYDIAGASQDHTGHDHPDGGESEGEEDEGETVHLIHGGLAGGA